MQDVVCARPVYLNFYYVVWYLQDYALMALKGGVWIAGEFWLRVLFQWLIIEAVAKSFCPNWTENIESLEIYFGWVQRCRRFSCYKTSVFTFGKISNIVFELIIANLINKGVNIFCLLKILHSITLIIDFIKYGSQIISRTLQHSQHPPLLQQLFNLHTPSYIKLKALPQHQ